MSRLERGQTAVGILRKQEACRKSVLARVEVLAALLKGDAEVSQFAEHFRSISMLCGWACPQKNIEEVSIKTFRAHIEAMYGGGMQKFKEDMRRFNNHVRTIKSPTAKQLTEHRADAVLAMVERYQDLVEKMTRMSNTLEPVKHVLQAHFQKFGDVSTGKSQVIYASFRKDSGS